MATEVSPRGTPYVANPSTGSDVTIAAAKVTGYELITDGTNACTLQIYQDSTSGALLWQATRGGVNPGGFSFGADALLLPNKNGKFCFHVTGTGASAFVKVSND